MRRWPDGLEVASRSREPHGEPGVRSPRGPGMVTRHREMTTAFLTPSSRGCPPSFPRPAAGPRSSRARARACVRAAAVRGGGCPSRRVPRPSLRRPPGCRGVPGAGRATRGSTPRRGRRRCSGGRRDGPAVRIGHSCDPKAHGWRWEADRWRRRVVPGRRPRGRSPRVRWRADPVMTPRRAVIGCPRRARPIAIAPMPRVSAARRSRRR